MTRGDKSAYTDKQKRQAEHIEKSERKEGRSEKDAERIAWATVNKHDGGGKRSGSGCRAGRVRRIDRLRDRRRSSVTMPKTVCDRARRSCGGYRTRRGHAS